REALGRGSAELSLSQGMATLRPRDGPRCSALELRKLPAAEASSQLRALLFGMAVRVQSLESRLEGCQSTWLPFCNPCPACLTEADPSSRKNRNADSALPAKRRIPGESLINPGFKSKKAPSGVDFEDS
ncbi:PAXX protein, partial [Psilopogon haemacephalus]|nr:PAXX protein [Psilopogon haemacephalus]